jgi:hypothetical protein
MAHVIEPEPGQDILEYRSALAFNREIFLLNFGAQFHAFRQIDENFVALTRPAEMKPGRDGRSSAGFLPPMLLLRRQANVAFDSLSSHQSYQAWVLLRPGLEASLMVGKWLDDPKTFEIWKRRLDEPRAYSDTFSGKNLRSKSLDRSRDLQSVLRRINDDFMHANPTYYRRHMDRVDGLSSDVTLLLQYFDDAPDHGVVPSAVESRRWSGLTIYAI